MNNNNKCSSLSRTLVLRTVLIAGLLAAAAICAAFSYVSLRNAEHEVGIQTYESIAASALNGAQAITRRKVEGSEVMATMLSYILPDRDMWPKITFDGYIPIAQKVASLSNSTSQSINVLLDPAKAEEWENHTKQIYVDQERPETAGVSGFGFGIWKDDNSSSHADKRGHDISGETNWGGKAGILAPLMMHNVPNSSTLLFNTYSQADRGVHLDSMFSCVNENKAGENAIAYPSCAVMTDILETKARPGPAALLFLPIFPANEPTELVGFTSTSIAWEDVLASIVPSYVNGLICVVSTLTQRVTYEIQNGVAVLLAKEDTHDPRYDEFSRSVKLNSFMESGAESSAIYTLTVYPSTVMFETFTTNSPLTVSIAFFVIIITCIGVFFMYDYLMRSEVHQRRAVLEMKRRFVRFISHEIRTPLNTVCMGLELLESELRNSLLKKDGNMEKEEMKKRKDLDFWHGITTDVLENATVAVSILNDLLNYDRLESGLLKLECNQVRIWDLISRTFNQMKVQAVNKGINLEAEFSVGDAAADVEMGNNCFTSTELCVIGEDVRIMQVLRNVMSNALKFTRSGGTTRVNAQHIDNGLPNAKHLMIEDSSGLSSPACTHPRAGSILIRVEDDGVGMSPDQLKLLFGEGVQFDAGKLQHGGGSGLGLHIARGMVEQHNGIIRAESAGLNQGTTFILELPLYACPVVCEKEQDMSGAPTDTLSRCDSDDAISRPRRILVAEDALSSRKMLIRLLERAGHTCVAAVDGSDAVAKMREDLDAAEADPCNHRSIDTVLMDYEMPILNGPDATREIRETLGFRGLIVGVTGNVMVEDVEHFRKCGANEVFAKPISLDTLRGYWQKHPLQQEGAAPESGKQTCT